MIWLTWRQQRTETLIAGLLLALLAALLIPTGLQIADAFDNDGIAACLASPGSGCGGTLSSFDSRFGGLKSLTGWFNLLPGILGILVAVPFVLEFEHGTFRLAWTQSITRRRWLTTRLTLIALAALASGLLLTLLMTWWRDPFDQVSGRMIPEGFNFEGLVPLAYTLFAAALVVAIGVVLRRAAPAIGLALVGFLAVRLSIEVWARPHYQAPVNTVWSGKSAPELRTAWILEEGPSDAAGRSIDGGLGGQPALGVDVPIGPGEFFHALNQPADRFWLFQGIETGIFAALAAALLVFSVWWVRRRIS